MTSPAGVAHPDHGAALDQVRDAYDTLVGKGITLDLTRGKPSVAQLDLATPILSLPGADHRSADGTDTRNYQGLQGLPELRTIFSAALQVPVAQLVAFGNSSLELMHDTLVHCLLSPVPGAEKRWVEQETIKFLAPVPGYDRHFGVSDRLGIELITVPMDDNGPDMDVVERLVAEDASIKGIWCVPKYSNPTGAVYSDDVVRRLAAMPAAAPDFRIMWDNAYTVHHLTAETPEVADILTLAAEAGHADRVFVFGSTSKITLAGAGVAFFGSSQANVDWWLKLTSKRTIGPDKVNHLRHALFFVANGGLDAHMQRHREILEPKFAVLEKILSENFSATPGVSWTTPKGGYFVTLTLPAGTASEVVRLAKGAGVNLTPAGATHPGGVDPDDAVLRLAPSFPPLDEVREAMEGVAICVKLALLQKA